MFQRCEKKRVDFLHKNRSILKKKTAFRKHSLWLGRLVLDNDTVQLLMAATVWPEKQIFESKKTGESGGLALWKQRRIWDECLKKQKKNDRKIAIPHQNLRHTTTDEVILESKYKTERNGVKNILARVEN